MGSLCLDYRSGRRARAFEISGRGCRSLGLLQKVSRRIGFLRSVAVGCKYLGRGKLILGAFVSL